MSKLATNSFESRHIGPSPSERDEMLRAIGVATLDELIDQTIPPGIRLDDPLSLPEPLTEAELLAHLRELGGRNRTLKSYIGMGYYDCHTPSVILRNMLENPGWYTPYTPYQAEIAQGRLEALINFQTMVTDLTGMDVANASLLDEATAAAEAMAMMYRLQRRRTKKGAGTFLVSNRCYPHTVDVLLSHASPLGIQVELRDLATMEFDEKVFGLLVQFPDGHGQAEDLSELIARAHQHDVLVAAATDLLALTMLTPPGEMGTDIVFGNSQRFGVPMGYGGPHAAFCATREKLVREMPGRIIGVSVDANGQAAYRMALQTREQHIRREKAKSNICTAQALLANIAGMYAVHHGPDGLKAIAQRTHAWARSLDAALRDLGFEQVNRTFFDTLRIEATPSVSDDIRDVALKAGMNFRYFEGGGVGISLDETTTAQDIQAIVETLACAIGKKAPVHAASDLGEDSEWPAALRRKSAYLEHKVFNTHHSESQMMRYLKSLERKDVGLDTSMIPLGSCTMKLNAATEMIPVTWTEFGCLHPFVPADQASGYHEIFERICRDLCRITGFAAVSLQPNSGAQGEYAGLMVIRAYHHDRGDARRTVVLIPSSAHGTNPASAVLAGMQVVVVPCDDEGNIDVESLQALAEKHADALAGLMVTYPSTHGVFEEAIREICDVVHRHGGQVYMDGANLNAQVGLTSPATVGADVCHINLHKTFAIPHGGGGPGMGPIGVAEHLAPYLPGHTMAQTGGTNAIQAVSGAPWGSASIILISYAYVRMLGAQGLTESTRHAILNANYIKARLAGHYDVLFTGPHGRVAHEMIFDLRPFKQASGVDEIDVAKRLMDFGFHAPTVAWPVPGTMMIEPTESEDKGELDRFCDALIAIRGELQDIMDGKADKTDNVLKHAPHTAASAASDTWSHSYSREQAVYPLPFVHRNKVWPAVGRIDNTYGDRHLVCSCPPMDAYTEETTSS